VSLSNSRTIKTAITRTVLWVVATVVASAVGFREFARSADQSFANEAALNGVAAALRMDAELFLQAAAARQPGNQTLCDRLLTHPMTRGAWLLDADGVQIDRAYDFAGGQDQFGQLAVDLRATRHFTLRSFDEGQPPTATALLDIALTRPARKEAAPDRRGPAAATLRLLLAPPLANPPWYSRLWMYAPLLAVGAVGSAVGLRTLFREIVSPLSELTRWISENEPGDAKTLADSTQEFSHIAAIIKELRGDRDEWRARAERHARDLHAEVAQKTQAIYGELRRAQRELWNDPLTGLNNRRVLDERFPDIFNAQCDAGQDLSVVMVDIDNFKQLNDAMGHACGDELIRFAADLIRGSLRSNDIALRYGGDEFTLILPSVSAEEAEAIAKRIVALFAQRAKLFRDLSPRPSLSAGVASLWTHRPRTAQELTERADKALYVAKNGGRNRVCVANRTEQIPPGASGVNARTPKPVTV
jgi:diguanylate cyclase (GGDEF)-like protein